MNNPFKVGQVYEWREKHMATGTYTISRIVDHKIYAIKSGDNQETFFFDLTFDKIEYWILINDPFIIKEVTSRPRLEMCDE